MKYRNNNDTIFYHAKLVNNNHCCYLCKYIPNIHFKNKDLWQTTLTNLWGLRQSRGPIHRHRRHHLFRRHNRQRTLPRRKSRTFHRGNNLPRPMCRHQAIISNLFRRHNRRLCLTLRSRSLCRRQRQRHRYIRSNSQHLSQHLSLCLSQRRQVCSHNLRLSLRRSSHSHTPCQRKRARQDLSLS